VLEKLALQPNEKKRIQLSKTPYTVKISADISDASQLVINLFGRQIICDSEKNSITLSKYTSPLSLTPGKTDVVIISDQCSLEIYADGGKFYMGTVDENTCCDYNLPYIELIANGACEIQRMELHSLKSIWEK
jgi:hypothetical protein